MIWTTEDADGGLLTWMPKTLLPARCCLCFTPVKVDDVNEVGLAVELRCENGHRWLNVLHQLRMRTSTCARCGAAGGQPLAAGCSLCLEAPPAS